MGTGPKNCVTDVAGIAVGSAEDERAETGVTVLLPDEAAICAVDVRGGGPGTRETDALRLEGLVERADAVVLAGGSVYGLAAADAVTARLGAKGRGFALAARKGVPPSPIVPAAILYDLVSDGEKDWGTSPPYARLGEEALSVAGARVALGRKGAGRGAMAGAYPGGLGSASWVLPGGATVGAVVAVNSFGSPYVPDAEESGSGGTVTNRFWAAPWEVGREFGGRGVAGGAAGFPSDTKAGAYERQNTTIAVVATDAVLTKAQARRLAIMAQDGLARALRPAHGPTDGDVVFALSTEKLPLDDPEALSLTMLGTAAADVLARAIARAVYAAE